MESETAEGRYICCNVTWTQEQLANFLREKFSHFPISPTNMSGPYCSVLIRIASYFQPAGVGQYVRANLGCVPDMDNSKIKRDLNFEFTPIEKTIEGFFSSIQKEQVLLIL